MLEGRMKQSLKMSTPSENGIGAMVDDISINAPPQKCDIFF